MSECYGEVTMSECYGAVTMSECYGEVTMSECYGEVTMSECYGEVTSYGSFFVREKLIYMPLLTPPLYLMATSGNHFFLWALV